MARVRRIRPVTLLRLTKLVYWQFARTAVRMRLFDLRLSDLKLAVVIGLIGASICLASGDPVAARLARAAKKAQSSGQLVRAYMLYNEAAGRDPANPHYRVERDSLASAARLLSKADVTPDVDISDDIKAAEGGSEKEPDSPSIHEATVLDLEEAPR